MLVEADRLWDVYRQAAEQLAAETDRWDEEIAKKRTDYNHCQSGLGPCVLLLQANAATVRNCQALETQLHTARLQQQRQREQQQREQQAPSRSPAALSLVCTPNPVPPNGTVNCTFRGVFHYEGASGGEREFDLTNDPETRWENGPRVSATGMRPGQTFTVRATRGNISDKAIITVAEGQQAQRAVVRIDLRDATTNQPVAGWVDFGGKDLASGSSFTYPNTSFGNIVVKAGANGYKDKTMTLTVSQNPYNSVIQLEKVARVASGGTCAGTTNAGTPERKACCAREYADPNGRYFCERMRKMDPDDAKRFRGGFGR